MDLDYSEPVWLTDEFVKVLEFYYPTCAETRYDGFCGNSTRRRAKCTTPRRDIS